MKKLLYGIFILMAALLVVGCCKSVDKAKDIAKTAKNATQVATRLTKDIGELQSEDGHFDLTQARLQKFFKNYPIFVSVIESKSEKVDNMEEGYNKDMMSIESFVKLDEDFRKAGIDNPAEFYLTIVEVSGAYSYVASKEFMENAQGQMDEAITAMKAQLQNPDLPAEQKAAIKDAIAEMNSTNTEEAQGDLPEGLTQVEIDLVKANFDKISEILGMDPEEAEEEGEVS
ncbi:hypothetical protein KAH81_08830 [bacterium]|nr:hypothetical protein [bacterium]